MFKRFLIPAGVAASLLALTACAEYVSVSPVAGLHPANANAPQGFVPPESTVLSPTVDDEDMTDDTMDDDAAAPMPAHHQHGGSR
jgi:hypothetical protein